MFPHSRLLAESNAMNNILTKSLLSAVILGVIVLAGCGMSKAKLAETVKGGLQQSFDSKPETREFRLKVQQVSLVKQSDHQYQGIAKIEFEGNVYDVPVDVTADGSEVLWKVNPLSFIFVAKSHMNEILNGNPEEDRLNAVRQLLGLKEFSDAKSAVAELYVASGAMANSCEDLPVCSKGVSIGGGGRIIVNLDSISAGQWSGKVIVVTPKVAANGDIDWTCSTNAEFRYVPSQCRVLLTQPIPIKESSPATARTTIAPSAAVELPPPLPTAPVPPSPKGQAATVTTPSFDCGKAASEVEKLICGNPSLAADDAEMATFYKKNIAASGADAATIKQGQRAFITTRNQCETVACIAEAYRARHEEMAQLGYVKE
jgi:uncharacterized protein YecT (DUF1311 family)